MKIVIVWGVDDLEVERIEEVEDVDVFEALELVETNSTRVEELGEVEREVTVEEKIEEES